MTNGAKFSPTAVEPTLEVMLQHDDDKLGVWIRPSGLWIALENGCAPNTRVASFTNQLWFQLWRIFLALCLFVEDLRPSAYRAGRVA